MLIAGAGGMRLWTLSLVTLSCALAAVTACSDAPKEDDAKSEESNATNADDLYVKTDVMEVTIAAPLQQLFDRFKAGKADPPPPVPEAAADAEAGAPPPNNGFQEPEFSEPGKLTFKLGNEEKSLDMRVYTRGESSKNDCPFMKLKIDFTDKEQLKKTPFKGHGKFRLNTHCGPGDESARSGMGRVFNGVGPIREELTYRIIRAMGIHTYGTRNLAVHYEDTGNGTKLDSFAVAIESGDDAAQRFQEMDPPVIAKEAEYLDPNDAWGLQITPENTAAITVAEAFSGNKDWGGTHNIDSFGVKADKSKGFQIAQDFDLGAITQADIAKYWKGLAPITDAQKGLTNAAVAKNVAEHKDQVYKAYAQAEKECIAAKAIKSTDGKTTTDPGFLEAKKRIDGLFALPEIQNALGGGGDADGGADAGAKDAGGDAK